MRVKVTIPTADVDKVRPKILESAESVEKDTQGADEWEAVSVTSCALLLRGSFLLCVGHAH